MYCEHCGAKTSNHAQFCRNCGAPMGKGQTSDSEARTTVLERKKATDAGAEAKTTVMPQPKARHRKAESNPAPTKPAPRKRNLLPLIAAAVIIALVAIVAIAKLAGNTSPKDTDEQTQQTETTETPTATDPEDAKPTENTSEQTTTPEDTNTENGTAPAASTFEDWTSTARAFMSVYPCNHVRTGDADPVALSIEEWAERCLAYVDPNSDLGQALQNDPTSVAAPLGFYEVASFVSVMDVVRADSSGVKLEVTITGTQMDWDHTSDYIETFFLTFNDNGQITSVS